MSDESRALDAAGELRMMAIGVCSVLRRHGEEAWADALGEAASRAWAERPTPPPSTDGER